MPPYSTPPPPSIPSVLPRVLEPEVMDSEEVAREYDEMDHEEVNVLFVDDLLKLPVELGRTLDIGTGTAQLPIVLCRRVPSARVVAVDLSDSMLSLGKRNVERAGLSGTIRLECRDGKELRYDDDSFRTVLSNGMLHHSAKPEGLIAEMTRVLAPGGWLFVRDLARPTDEGRLAQIVDRYTGDARQSHRDMYETSLRAGLRPEEIADMLKDLSVRGASISMTSDRHWTLTWKKP
jgi:ubiquinone/menaquinone biosynthesis C-methylase UbiE